MGLIVRSANAVSVRPGPKIWNDGVINDKIVVHPIFLPGRKLSRAYLES